MSPLVGCRGKRNRSGTKIKEDPAGAVLIIHNKMSVPKVVVY